MGKLVLITLLRFLSCGEKNSLVSARQARLQLDEDILTEQGYKKIAHSVSCRSYSATNTIILAHTHLHPLSWGLGYSHAHTYTSTQEPTRTEPCTVCFSLIIQVFVSKQLFTKTPHCCKQETQCTLTRADAQRLECVQHDNALNLCTPLCWEKSQLHVLKQKRGRTSKYTSVWLHLWEEKDKDHRKAK